MIRSISINVTRKQIQSLKSALETANIQKHGVPSDNSGDISDEKENSQGKI